MVIILVGLLLLPLPLPIIPIPPAIAIIGFGLAVTVGICRCVHVSLNAVNKSDIAAICAAINAGSLYLIHALLISSSMFTPLSN